MGGTLLIWLPFLVLALLGWLLAGIPGVLLGVVIAVWLERSGQTARWLKHWQSTRQQAAAYTAEHSWFMLLGFLAKSNGRVLPEHIQAARLEMRRLGLDGYRYQAAIAAFNQGKEQELDVLRSSLRAHFSQPAQADRLLSSAWRLVWAEGRASRAQYQALRRCAGWMSVSTERLLQLEQQARPARKAPREGSMKVRLTQRDRALQQLGLRPPVDDFALVRRAYRRLLSEHHPDRLMGAGASAREIERATEKTSELHAAYEVLRRYYRQR